MHDHAHARSPSRRLALVLALASVYLIAEVVGGLWTGSLALLADASHMLSDVAALALALFAAWLSQRPASEGQTFGRGRVEVLAALANGAALLAVAGLILFEAVSRLREPSEVMGLPMLVVAVGGLLVNLTGLWILSGSRGDSLNMRGAFLHVLSDALGSAGAIAAGIGIWAFGWTWADPVASIVIALLVIRASLSLLRETVSVLMEEAPRGLDLGEVRSAMHELSGVDSVHDLHVWTVGNGLVSLSCHVSTVPEILGPRLLLELQMLLRERFSIHHTTIQIEPEGFAEEASLCPRC